MKEIFLTSIPHSKYQDYRYEVIFSAYKWDPQVYDENTIASNVLFISNDTAEQLECWAEQLKSETIQIEEALLKKAMTAK